MRRKAVEENADHIKRQAPPIFKLPRTAGVVGRREKALEPAAKCGCGGGGQERLYGKPNTEKGTLVRRALSSIWRATQALTQEKRHAKTFPRAIGTAGGSVEKTTNNRDERWSHFQPREG